MEYIDGEDLGTLLQRIGRVPEDKALELARQICAGLAAAHDAGILHRDLKPANVMIDGRGRARLTDFGLASLGGDLRDEEIRSGTPAYMAPEQLAGREVTVRSDLYALGLVLYELFTGRRAFEPAPGASRRRRPRRRAGCPGSTRASSAPSSTAWRTNPPPGRPRRARWRRRCPGAIRWPPPSPPARPRRRRWSPRRRGPEPSGRRWRRRAWREWVWRSGASSSPPAGSGCTA